MMKDQKKWLTSKGMARMSAAGLCLAMLLAGCGKEDEEKEDKPSSTPAPVSSVEPTSNVSQEPEIDPEMMDIIKFNIYVEMNNEIVDLLGDLDSYYLVVADEDEFSLLPDSQYTYKYDISPYNTDILEDAKLVAEMEPAYEQMDELTLKILEPMENLMTTFDSIYSSYDFADNQYAKPKEFHKAIRANQAAFLELAYPYMDEMSRIGKERRSVEEQKMKDEGNLIIYNVSHSISLGKDLVSECAAQEVYDDNISALDLTKIRPIYEEMKATAEAYKAAVADKNQLMKESLSYPPMDGLLDSLCQSVEWMIRQVESGQPLSSPGCLGSIAHIEEVISDCIDRYNTTFTE